MRKYILFILLLTNLFGFTTVHAQDAETPKAFFVYRNDGQFNAFFYDEIDSISFSNLDADSVLFKDIVTQEIWTTDTVYRIPLASIDSVGFQKLPTVYKEGVTELSGVLRSYILSVDTMTIFFDSSTPIELLPKVGNKLVTTEVSNVFFAGFAGKVSNVIDLNDSIAIICDSISLKDVYERYYGVYKVSYDDAADYTTRNIDTTFNAKVPTFKQTFDLSPWCSPYASFGEVGVSADQKVHVKVETPRATFSVIHTVGWWNVPDFIRISAVMNHVETMDWEFSGSISMSFIELPILKKNWLPIPIAPYVNFLFSPNVFLQGSVETTSIYTTVRKLRSNISYEYDASKITNDLFTNDIHKIKYNSEILSSDLNLTFLNVKGDLRGGLALKWGVEVVDQDILSAFWRFDIGGYASSDWILSKDDIENLVYDNSIYTVIKTRQISLGTYTQNSMGVEMVDNIGSGFSFAPIDNVWRKFNYVPLFSNLQIAKSIEDGMVTLSAQLENPILLPMYVGFRLYDENHNIVNTIYYNKPYGGIKNDFIFDVYALKFSGLVTNKKYVAYPILKFYKFEMLASPKLEFILEGKIETLSASCTDESATFNGYTEGEENYKSLSSYGFIYGTNSNLTAESGIMIAAKGNENGNFSVYVDGLTEETTYYYCAYLCIDGVYTYGETLSFTTPKEPEITEVVNLGLSVNWRGWNVGATVPEEYGGYYAWGEDSVKEAFSWDTYWDSPYDEGNNWVGCQTTTDIAGTDKDVATTVLGEKWRMPTYEEMQELMNKCTWTWTTINGVNGYKVTSNVDGYVGNFIFLPAAGNGDKSGIINVGTYGGYWTSTPLESTSKAAAYNLYFYGETIHAVQNTNRYTGRSIRPVTTASE